MLSFLEISSIFILFQIEHWMEWKCIDCEINLMSKIHHTVATFCYYGGGGRDVYLMSDIVTVGFQISPLHES